MSGTSKDVRCETIGVIKTPGPPWCSVSPVCGLGGRKELCMTLVLWLGGAGGITGSYDDCRGGAVPAQQ